MKASMRPLYRVGPAASIRFLRAWCKLLGGLQVLLLKLHGLVHLLSRLLLGLLRLLELLLPGRGAGGRRAHGFDAAAGQRSEYEQHDDWSEFHGRVPPMPLLARGVCGPVEKRHPLLRTLVDDALCLAHGALDCAGLHVGADADVGLDAVPEACDGSRVALDYHGEMIEGAFFGDLEHIVRAQARLPQDQLLDLR